MSHDKQHKCIFMKKIFESYFNQIYSRRLIDSNLSLIESEVMALGNSELINLVWLLLYHINPDQLHCDNAPVSSW